jgi:hypothetical protein
MKTLNLKEAAEFLKMTPEGLRVKAARGEVPGAKPGKCWCFFQDDLAEHLRSLYSSSAKKPQGVLNINRSNTWHSTKEKTLGGLTSVTVEKEYRKVLERQTK